jgi:hypothetical protein
MQVKVKQVVVLDATTILVNANVRYWEDGYIDGVRDDADCPNMPCAVKGDKGYRWMPIIDIEIGQIRNWREGTTAEIRYKVCDEFECRIIDEKGGERCLITDFEGYVPNFMSPKDCGYGDYIIMDIDENGYIQDWDKAEVRGFIENEEE